MHAWLIFNLNHPVLIRLLFGWWVCQLPERTEWYRGHFGHSVSRDNAQCAFNTAIQLAGGDQLLFALSSSRHLPCCSASAAGDPRICREFLSPRYRACVHHNRLRWRINDSANRTLINDSYSCILDVLKIRDSRISEHYVGPYKTDAYVHVFTKHFSCFIQFYLEFFYCTCLLFLFLLLGYTSEHLTA